jgi:uncharacterized protein GlcG (DUF336 family)
MRFKQSIGLISAAALALAGCGGGGSSTTSAVTPPPPPPTPTLAFQVPAAESLSVTDVQQVIAQAVGEAQARNKPSIIAVVDRVGNVLGVFAMTGSTAGTFRIPINTGRTPTGRDLRDIRNPANGQPLPGVANAAGAIAKAVTGAYLSSGGNAFSTRTASQIVQEHFPPAPQLTPGLESGPLYGVQFSALPCSDLVARFKTGGGSTFVNPATGMQADSTGLIGPKRSPLGLSADAGGFPLYKNGVVVGGVGVMSDGFYSFDNNILDVDAEDDEFIAIAATRGFDAPEGVRANRITVDGTSLRYSDATPAGLRATASPTFAAINGPAGGLAPVRGYSDGVIVAGTTYGSEVSGVRASLASEFSNRDAFVLSDGAGNNRFPVRGATDSAQVTQPITLAESRALLEEAFLIMTRARAQIRQPLDSRAQVSISLVDTFGSVLGVVRSPDAPIFGIDVSLQKARTAAFFSNSRAAAELAANSTPEVRARLTTARTFFSDPNIFTGQTGWTNRAIGNIARPFFPDGEVGRGPGAFSPGIGDFNPFNTGIQSELIFDDVLSHVLFVLGVSGTDISPRCTKSPAVTGQQNRLQNGIQIFPGSVPVYRGSMLIGALGVSGDGIDQDDMVAFLGTNNAGTRLNTGLGNAPSANRSDQVVVQLQSGANVRLRFVGCPFAAFLDTAEQNVCQGR